MKSSTRNPVAREADNVQAGTLWKGRKKVHVFLHKQVAADAQLSKVRRYCEMRC